MKKYVFSLLSLVLSLVVSAQSSNNLISNGGFETWNSGSSEPDGWSVSDPAYTFKKSTDAHQGSYSLLIEGTFKFKTTVNNIEENTEYDFSYWYKNTAGIPMALVRGTYYNGTSQISSSPLKSGSPRLVSSTDWKEEKFTITSPAGANKLEIEITFIARPSGNIDDISLVKKVNASTFLPVPTNFSATPFQREIELKWDKSTDDQVQWEVVVDNSSSPVRVTGNKYVIPNLDPGSTHTMKIRAVKDSNYSDYTREESVSTKALDYQKENSIRIPYLRTLDLDGTVPQTIWLYYNDLANKDSIITYTVDGSTVTPNNNQLTFPKKGKQTLSIHIKEEEGYEWNIDYNLDVQ